MTSALHVLVCEAFHGPRPEGMVARHINGDKLDNRAENLCWGTPAENYQDRDAHGATARGSRQGLAKLTEADIPQIRALLRQGRTQLEVAEQFGVKEATVASVAHGRTWKHVPDVEGATPYREGAYSTRGHNNGNSRLTEYEVRGIRQAAKDGMSQRQIAKIYDVSQPLVSTIVRRATWAHLPDE